MKNLHTFFLLFFLVIAYLTLSFIQTDETVYIINPENVEKYRNHPVSATVLLEIIRNNDNFIKLEGNPDLTEATVEHHLIDEIKNGSNTTFIVFEYFVLEGLYCNIQAVTVDESNQLKSILRLAEYEEYPDGGLNESSKIVNDLLTRTTVVNGLKEYNDSLDKYIMKVDSTIVNYRLNKFENIQLIDSVFKHYEYLE